MRETLCKVPPNTSLQRTVIDKVLARGQRQGDLALPARWMRLRAAAELSR
jgi:hypothetical protein